MYHNNYFTYNEIAVNCPVTPARYACTWVGVSSGMAELLSQAASTVQPSFNTPQHNWLNISCNFAAFNTVAQSLILGWPP